MNTDSTFTNLVPGVVDSLIFTEKTRSVETKLSLSQNTWSLEETFVAAFRHLSLGNRRCELVIQSSQVPASLTDFPVLLTAATLPSEMFDADGSYPALDGGGDIKFSSDEAGATRLSCEIVTFTTDNNPANGTAEIWVKVPSVSGSLNTSIWVWYDNSGESQPDSNAAFGSESVWDSNYVGVWHLNETVVDEQTTGTHTDATSNNNDGSQNGNDDIAGKIDNAQDFTPIDDIRLGTWSVSGTAITMQAWANFDDLNQDDPRLISKATGTGYEEEHVFMLSLSGSGDQFLRMRIKTGTSDTEGTTTLVASSGGLTAGTWHLVAGTYDGSTMRLYKDGGTEVGSTSKTGSLRVNGWEIWAGNNPNNTSSTSWASMDGKLDELRISSVARSANWLTTEYNNQDSPSTFVIEGTPETP